MTAHTAGEVPPASASHPKRIWRSRSVVRVALAVAAVLVLLVGFEVSIRLVPPDAVLVSASSSSGRTLATREIADARTVSDLYAGINDLPGAGLSADYNCVEPAPNALAISFRFTRWGLPVEGATLPGDGCGSWSVTRGGIPDSRYDPNGQTRAILSEAQLPVLLP